MAYHNPSLRSETWGKNHPRMSVVERARQFLPFAAISGVSDAMKQKAHILLPRPLLSEDQDAQMNAVLQGLKADDYVAVKLFCSKGTENMGEVAFVEAKVLKLDKTRRMLHLSSGLVPFQDIIAIEQLEAKQQS